MNGVSVYEFEKLMGYQAARTANQSREAWKLADVRGKRWTMESLTAVFFRRHDEDGLERKAYRVLEELLKDEKAEIRLRAAEIIVGCRQGNRAS